MELSLPSLSDDSEMFDRSVSNFCMHLQLIDLRQLDAIEKLVNYYFVQQEVPEVIYPAFLLPWKVKRHIRKSTERSNH